MDVWSQRVAEIIRVEAGLDLSRCRAANLRSVLGTIATEMGLRGPEAVLEAAGGKKKAFVVERLLSALLIHETFFYRYRTQLDVIAERVLPTLIADAPRTLRLWSAGCSTGPETYTLAMIALVAREKARARIALEVIGSDVSPSALATAEAAIYPSTSVEDLPLHLRERFLESAGPTRYRVTKEAKRIVRFQIHNLCDGPLTGPFHLICCRNVLMYLQSDVASMVIGHLAAALSPKGLIAVGHGESLRSFEPILVPDRDTSVNLYRSMKREPLPKASVKAAPFPTKANSPVHGRPAVRSSRQGNVRRIVLHGVYDEHRAPDRLASLRAALAAALTEGGPVEIDADRADSLDGETARIIGRALRAASGRIQILATRPPVRIWAQRHGLPLLDI